MADTCIRLSKFFNTSVEFWLNAQNRYHLEVEMQRMEHYSNIDPYNAR